MPTVEEKNRKFDRSFSPIYRKYFPTQANLDTFELLKRYEIG